MTEITVEHEQKIQQIDGFLTRHGLHTPALIVLEFGQPFVFVGSQLLWIAQPFLSLFMPKQAIQQMAELLEHPTAVRAHLQRLEDTHREI